MAEKRVKIVQLKTDSLNTDLYVDSEVYRAWGVGAVRLLKELRDVNKFLNVLETTWLMLAGNTDLYELKSMKETGYFFDSFGLNWGGWRTSQESADWVWQMAEMCVDTAAEYGVKGDFRVMRLNDGKWKMGVALDPEEVVDRVGDDWRDVSRVVGNIWSFGGQAWQVRGVAEMRDMARLSRMLLRM